MEPFWVGQGRTAAGRFQGNRTCAELDRRLADGGSRSKLAGNDDAPRRGTCLSGWPMRNPLRISALLLVAGCGSEVVTLASDEDNPSSVAVDASSVYWIAGTYGANSIRRVPISGGTPTTVLSGAARHIAADRANLYWVGPDAVMRLPSGGGSSIQLATAPSGIRIAVEGADG